MEDNLYDLSILSEMVYGDTEFMKDLVNTFVEHAPIDSKELASFAYNKNWEEASKKAHKLKSSIRTVGVTSLFDLILKIEMDAKNNNNLDSICDKIDQFTSTLELVVKSLEKETFKDS